MRGQGGRRRRDEGGPGRVRQRRLKEAAGCQRQGGPPALNGSLVRKVEGGEAQIKDVPSPTRKSSHPRILKGCLKGEEDRGRKRLPPSGRPAADEERCRHQHNPRACPAIEHARRETHCKHLRTADEKSERRAKRHRVERNCLCKCSFFMRAPCLGVARTVMWVGNTETPTGHLHADVTALLDGKKKKKRKRQLLCAGESPHI